MNRNRSRNGLRSTSVTPWLVLCIAVSSGCQHKSLLTDPEILKRTAASGDVKESLVLQAGNWAQAPSFEPGTPHGDLQIGEALFRAEDYGRAAKVFVEVAEKHKEVPDIHERALFMKGECEFQQGLLAEARDSFQEFRKTYPGSRHTSAAMQHLFAIGDIWLEEARRDVRRGKPSSVHRFLHLDPDRKPLFDLDGHAVETLKYVRDNDPNGPLADDSLMIAAGYHFTMGDYQQADSLTDLLIHSYPHSEFQAQAHLLNAEAKIHSYKGAAYDGRKLEEARRTLRSAVAQFSDELDHDRQRVFRELEEINQEQAKAQFEIAEWYRRMGDRTPKMADTYYRSAKVYYLYVQRSFAGTKWAERAAERLKELPDAPAPVPKYVQDSSGERGDSRPSLIEAAQSLYERIR